MSSNFTCDKCDASFGGPLDRISYNDKGYDLCAPCRKKLNDALEEVKRQFFEGETING